MRIVNLRLVLQKDKNKKTGLHPLIVDYYLEHPKTSERIRKKKVIKGLQLLPEHWDEVQERIQWSHPEALALNNQLSEWVEQFKKNSAPLPKEEGVNTLTILDVMTLKFDDIARSRRNEDSTKPLRTVLNYVKKDETFNQLVIADVIDYDFERHLSFVLNNSKMKDGGVNYVKRFKELLNLSLKKLKLQDKVSIDDWVTTPKSSNEVLKHKKYVPNKSDIEKWFEQVLMSTELLASQKRSMTFFVFLYILGGMRPADALRIRWGAFRKSVSKDALEIHYKMSKTGRYMKLKYQLSDERLLSFSIVFAALVMNEQKLNSMLKKSMPQLVTQLETEMLALKVGLTQKKPMVNVRKKICAVVKKLIKTAVKEFDSEQSLFGVEGLKVDSLTPPLNQGLKKFNNSLVLYSARHAFSVGLLSNGHHIHHIKQALGHSNLKTTEVYLRSIAPAELDPVSDLNQIA